MGDGDDRALVILEEALEPCDRFGVEVVRRLVEQQQIWRLQQQPAKRDAPPLAARERLDVDVRGGRRSASIASSSFESSSHAPAASIRSCTRACSASTLSISSGERSCANFSLISSNRWRSARISATPSSTMSFTVFAGSSWAPAAETDVIPSAGNASPTKS